MSAAPLGREAAVFVGILTKVVVCSVRIGGFGHRRLRELGVRPPFNTDRGET